MRFRDDIVRGVRLAGFAFAGLLVALMIHRTINFAGTADAKPTEVSAPAPDPNAFLAMPAPVVPAPPVTEPEPTPAPARPRPRPVVQEEQTVPPPPPPAPNRKGSNEFAAKYAPPRPVTPQTESLNAPAFIDPSIPHISAESLAAASEQTQAPAPPPGKQAEDAAAANAKLPPITPVFVVPPESPNKGHGMGWIKAVGRALKPKKDDQ